MYLTAEEAKESLEERICCELFNKIAIVTCVIASALKLGVVNTIIIVAALGLLLSIITPWITPILQALRMYDFVISKMKQPLPKDEPIIGKQP